MFVDLRSLEIEHSLEADICIVGAGPAGISVANRFVDSRLRIVIVESGDLCPRSEVQNLADCETSGQPQRSLKESRNRQFGGSSNSWGGACAPMSCSDFTPRPWIDLAGWPFSKQCLDPYYVRAQELFELGPFDYRPETWSNNQVRFLRFDEDHLENRIWQIGSRKNFGLANQTAFRSSANISVLLNATATELETNASASFINVVRVKSLEGREATIKARFFVLACGGIDNARLLLVSRQHNRSGLGNNHDLVGRYFMQHPHVSAASLRFNGARRWVRSYKDFKNGELWLRSRIGLAETAQEKCQVLNAVASVINRYIADSLTHTQSVGYVTIKRVLLNLQHGRLPTNLASELRSIIGDTKGIVTGLLRHLRNQDGALYFMSEQFPNPESRISLSEDCDSLGVPKARVNWQLLPIDKRSILALVQTIQVEFNRLGIGEVVPDEWLVVDDHSWPDSLFGGHHHMGTTRMSDSPKFGVVDPNARVHGVENLYIAGSSIFPTVGCANPTLTLVATSLKLADHLLEIASNYDEASAVA